MVSHHTPFSLRLCLASVLIKTIAHRIHHSDHSDFRAVKTFEDLATVKAVSHFPTPGKLTSTHLSSPIMETKEKENLTIRSPIDSESRSGGTIRQIVLTTSLDYPKLLRFDANNVRIFLRAYEVYCSEVLARAAQVGSASTTVPTRRVNLKFCVDAEYVTSLIYLGFIEGVQSDEKLSDDVLLTYLKSKAEESKDVITLWMRL